MSVPERSKGDIRRLPKWAQEHISQLETLLDRQDNHIAKLSYTHEGSNVVVRETIGYPSVTLPPNSKIRFYLGDSRDDYRDLIEIHHSRTVRGALEVIAYGGRFHISPQSGNAVALSMEGRL